VAFVDKTYSCFLFSRSEFVTTKTDDIAIAPAAISGESARQSAQPRLINIPPC